MRSEMDPYEYGISDFSPVTGLHFVCPVCETEYAHPVESIIYGHSGDPLTLSSRSATVRCPCSDRVFGGRSGQCPMCGSGDPHAHEIHHHVNFNIPDDHPHHSAKHVRALHAHLGPPVMAKGEAWDDHAKRRAAGKVPAAKSLGKLYAEKSKRRKK